MTLTTHTPQELNDQLDVWRAAGDRLAFVPTMGALHEGHLALVRAAQARASRVVVSIYVNPLQFGPAEDFSRYPRPLAQDLALLRAAGVDAAWLPDVAVMAPPDFATTVSVAGVSEGLCGAARPGHFAGVATVVTKLLLQVRPHLALFGMKDYQQLLVIRRCVTDLSIPVEIVGMPTVREADGLALSSRNRYLSVPERAVAAALPRVLRETAARLRAAAPVAPTLAAGVDALREAGIGRVEYLELRDGETLAPLSARTPAARLFAAVHVGTTRLIDNLAVTEE